MNIYQDINQMAKQDRTIVLGNFDGVHVGHGQLIRLAHQLAADMKQELMVFTFYPQLQAIFNADFNYLMPVEKKCQRFNQCGVDTVLIQPFTETFAQITPEDFIQKILIDTLGAKNIIVGFNYTFGYRGAGNVQLLTDIGERNGVNVVVMPPYYYDHYLVSSSLVRQFVQAGDMEQANALLGYPFSLKGEVVHGRKVGRTMGIPTANIKIAPRLTLPAKGVYATTVAIGEQTYLGVLNIGQRPTVDNGYDISVEVHILDFDQDIYGQIIEIFLFKHLRGESKFQGLDQLKRQIQLDMENTRRLLENQIP